ncbi:MAG: hypothetical protein ACRDCC_08425 [Culicoidibacterales bacterium]
MPSKNKKFTFVVPENYEKKLSAIQKEKNTNLRETFMFLIDNFSNIDNIEAKKQIVSLKEQLEFEKEANMKMIYELKKQTAMFNQLFHILLPENQEEFDTFDLKQHKWLEKYDSYSRNS